MSHRQRPYGRPAAADARRQPQIAIAASVTIAICHICRTSPTRDRSLRLQRLDEGKRDEIGPFTEEGAIEILSRLVIVRYTSIAGADMRVGWAPRGER